MISHATPDDLCTFCDSPSGLGGARFEDSTGSIFSCERCSSLVLRARHGRRVYPNLRDEFLSMNGSKPERSRWTLGVIATIGIGILSALSMSSAVVNAGLNLRGVHALEQIAEHCSK